MEQPKKGLIIAVEQGPCRYGLIEDFMVNTYLYIRWQEGDCWSGQAEVMPFVTPWRAATANELRTLPSTDSIGPRKERTSKFREDDPKNAEELRRLLEEYFSTVASKSAPLEKVFRNFWNMLMALRLDRPSRTWRMRTRTKFGMNPVLLIRNPRTLNDVQLAHFWATTDDQGAWISIIALNEWLTPEEADLFPNTGELYGNGRGVHIKLKDFNEVILQRYVACFRSIFKALEQ